MKATQINPVNLSVSLVYCLFGILSLFVLKIVARYFLESREEKVDVGKGKVCEEDVERVNFSKVLIKIFVMKNTLIGSLINKNKKYLLRQILVLSCMGVSCFNINSYILWPWTVGFGVFLITSAISQIIIPLIFQSKQNKHKIQQSQSSSRKNSTSVIDSNSIQIQHTQLQLSVSVQRQLNGSNNILLKNSISEKKIGKNLQMLPQKEKANLGFILIMAVIAQILFCQSILTLSLSVSNSGVLNVLSFGFSLIIDQFVARIGFGFVGFIICWVLQKSHTVNFFENQFFLAYCHQYFMQEIEKVHKQRLVEQMQSKIVKINNPQIHFEASSVHEKISDHHHNDQVFHEISTEMKIVLPCVFEEVFEEVPVHNIQVLPVDALLEEPQCQEQEFQSQSQAQKIQEIQKQQSSVKQEQQKIKLQPQQLEGQIQDQLTVQQQVEDISTDKYQNKQIDTKLEINYLELFEHDLQIFDDSKAYENMKIIPIKKSKKKYHQSQPKFKSDLLLYFPYEEHKLSHKISVQQQFKDNSQFQQTFSRDRSTIDNNFLSTIEIMDCTEDSVIRQEPQINLILQQKNMNIKHLTINQKPTLPPTSRPGYSEKKKPGQKNDNVKSMKKVSPYFVNLSSQAVKPPKTKKIQVSKNNKENANQTNKSFMTSQAINLSRITQKDTLNLATINNQNLMIKN